MVKKEMIDLATLEARHGTAAVLRAAREYIKFRKAQKSTLLNVERLPQGKRGKAPKGSNRKSTYLKTRRECDKAFSKMIRKQRPPNCELHNLAACAGITLPVRCGGKLQAYHIIPKSNQRGETIRYDPENCLVACESINFYESLHRGDMEKVHEQLFPDRLARLKEKMKWPKVKRNEAMLRAMIQEFNKR